MPLIALLLVAGCAQSPEDTLQWRESWELLGLLEGSRVLDARVTVGNTGLLRGQGRLQLALWEPQAAPIQFSRHAGPLAVERDPAAGRATIGTDGLAHEDGGWSLRVGDDNVNALVQLSPSTAAAPAQDSPEGWSTRLAVPFGDISGWITAGERGGLVGGRGLLLYRGGASPPPLPRMGAYVLSPALQLIVDQHGTSTVAWAQLDGQPLPTEGLTTDFPATGPATITLPGGTVTIRRRKTRGTTDPFEHLMLAERWLAAPLTGAPRRRLQVAQATIQLGGRTLRAPAIVLEVRAHSDFTRAP